MCKMHFVHMLLITMICICFCPLVCLVGFSQPSYVVHEGDRLVHLALNLSDISLTDITVFVLNDESDETAIGEDYVL